MDTQLERNMRITLFIIKVALAAFIFSLAFKNFADIAKGLEIDGFSETEKTSLGFPRIYMNDTMAGGQTIATHTLENGILVIEGKITPPRGQLGWLSTVLPVANEGEVKDFSEYKGLVIRVKLKQGNLSISANSADIQNFDFHASQVVVPLDNKFHNITIPFESMKRAWSEQTPLNEKTINSISIVAYSLQPELVNFAIDSVSLY